MARSSEEKVGKLLLSRDWEIRRKGRRRITRDFPLLIG